MPVAVFVRQPPHRPRAPGSDLCGRGYGGGHIRPFLRRQAAATPPPTGTTIYILEGTRSTTTAGAGFEQIAWTDASSFNDGTFLDFSAGSNPEVLGAGVYLFHIVVGGLVNAAGVDTTVELDLQTIAGSGGAWSSRYSAAQPKAFAQWLERLNGSGLANDVNAEGQTELFGVGTWGVGATFPVEVRARIDVLDDGVSTAHAYFARLSVVRIGTAFE